MKPFGLTNPHAPQREALRGRAAAPGQQARHAVQHGRLPDQAETWRAGRASSAAFPAWKTAEFARLGGLHRNTFLNSPKLLDATLRLKANPRCASPARSPAARAMSNPPPSGCSPARFAAAERRGETPIGAAADHGAWRAARPHHRRPYRDHRCRAVLVPADEREFRPVPAARRSRPPSARAANSAAARPRTWRARARLAPARSPISSAGWVPRRPTRRSNIPFVPAKAGTQSQLEWSCQLALGFPLSRE